MRKRFFYFVIALLFLAELSYAQSKVSFDAQIRHRATMDGRDFDNDTDPFGFSELRTRMGAKFTPSEIITGYIQIQDSRIFGTEVSTLANSQNLDVHQAFVQMNNFFKLPVDVKLGRMEYVIGPQRLVGAVGWSNVGRSFDGGVAKIYLQGVTLETFGFNISEQFNFGDALDLYFMGVTANFKISCTHSAILFGLNENIWDSDQLTRTTLGFYVKGIMKKFFHEAEFAYQLGDITNLGINQDVKAFMFAYNAGLKFESPIKPKIMVGLDYLSGDDNLGDSDYKVFNTIYATNHKYYGFMDYFLNIPAHTLGLGLMDIHGTVSIVPAKELSTSLKFHLFRGNEDYTLVNGNASKDFGWEADFSATYEYDANTNFQLGFSLFGPGEIMKDAGNPLPQKGDDISTWGYFLTTINF